MPDILIGSFKGAEADGDPKQALAAPQLGGSDVNGANMLGFAGVDLHLDALLKVTVQELLQSVIVLVLTQKNKMSSLRKSKLECY